MSLPAGVTQITFWRATKQGGYVDHDTPIAATFVREETREWPGSARYKQSPNFSGLKKADKPVKNVKGMVVKLSDSSEEFVPYDSKRVPRRFKLPAVWKPGTEGGRADHVPTGGASKASSRRSKLFASGKRRATLSRHHADHAEMLEESGVFEAPIATLAQLAPFEPDYTTTWTERWAALDADYETERALVGARQTRIDETLREGLAAKRGKVLRFIGRRYTDGAWSYKIRWEGSDAEGHAWSDSWEPFTNLKNAGDAFGTLHDFNLRVDEVQKIGGKVRQRSKPRKKKPAYEEPEEEIAAAIAKL